MKINNLPIFLILLLASFGCQYEKQSNVEICKSSTEDSISFKADILPIFERNCATSIDCHSGNSPAGNLNLEPTKAYMNLTRPKSGYIDTINPSRSLLYSALISVTQPMPPMGKLDDCSLQMILKWMDQNAKDN